MGVMPSRSRPRVPLALAVRRQRDRCSAGLGPVLHVVGPQMAVATPAPEAAQGMYDDAEERTVDGADDPTGAAARQGGGPRLTTVRIGTHGEAEDVALLLGLSGHRSLRRTHTTSTRRPTLPAVRKGMRSRARVPGLGVGPGLPNAAGPARRRLRNDPEARERVSLHSQTGQRPL